MEKRKTELSILIPVYNTVCVAFVRQIQKLAEQASIDYEIIVADDASTIQQCREQNLQIAEIPHCLYIIKEVNTGSAATRNFLAQKSRYNWLLFLDCDVEILSEQFISRYLTGLSSPVINGGLCICDNNPCLSTNLRYLYEKAEEKNHTAAKRQQRPYQSFRSTNFLIKREVMLNYPFDERFHYSGYEDVLFGKQLRLQNVGVSHIDNPVLMTDFEDNPAYIAKMERNLQTLYTFRRELKGYSKLITVADGIHIGAIRKCIITMFRLFRPLLRRNLCSSHPNLTIFKLYKTGYYLSINN